MTMSVFAVRGGADATPTEMLHKPWLKRNGKSIQKRGVNVVFGCEQEVQSITSVKDQIGSGHGMSQ